MKKFLILISVALFTFSFSSDNSNIPEPVRETVDTFDAVGTNRGDSEGPGPLMVLESAPTPYIITAKFRVPRR